MKELSLGRDTFDKYMRVSSESRQQLRSFDWFGKRACAAING